MQTGVERFNVQSSRLMVANLFIQKKYGFNKRKNILIQQVQATSIPSKIEGDFVILSSAFPSTKAQGKFC
jgi:hypothetical protein